MSGKQKPRELRRRVMLPARIRTASGWGDACILNISSRGMMIHAGRPFVQGSMIELRHQDHVIVARVVWREGAKAGLQSEALVPIEQIVPSADSAGFQLTAGQHRGPDRRRSQRSHEQNRVRARFFEFASLVIAAVIAGVAAFALVGEALAAPLEKVRLALGG